MRLGSSLVLLLRATGKRTLSKMNAFDLVVTVALGSTLATVLLSSDVSLSEGVLALALLIVLQFAVTWMSVRSERFKELVKAEPALVFHRGEFLERTLLRERLTAEEVEAAARQQGHSGLSDVEAIVLETGGSFSVITSSLDESDGRAMRNVSGPGGDRRQ